MIGNLLDKIVCEGNESIDKIMEVLPFIIIGGLWLLGAIAKTIQASKKSQQPGQPVKPVEKRQPGDLADFIRMVKEQYSTAKEKATKVIEPSSFTQQAPQIAAKPKPIYEVTTPAVQPAFEKPAVQEVSPDLKPVSLTPEELPEIKEEHPFETVTASEIERMPDLRELLKQYSTAADLRMAILHYEILGPPVSLREQI